MGSKLCRTAVKKRNLNPEWNEIFIFKSEDIKKAQGILEIHVWDKDFFTSDDIIGKVLINFH